ncbi:hypothetical protein [Burkholderia cepacia]|uniref:hypothetical protein n=1 Tax=Burkholderia cepacia TaxID=292 RepID=UPI00158AEFC4|nr:hypothetical protein [Burkholderia cepacia]
MSKIKFADIKTKEQLLSRVENGELSCGNQFKYIKDLLSYTQEEGMVKIRIIVSVSSGGSKAIYRYI